MHLNSSFNVSSVTLSHLPVQIGKIEGYFRGATADRWLQVWDTVAEPQTPETAVLRLVKEWPLYQTTEFYKSFASFLLTTSNGCFIGISTTEGTWTASADTMDISVETEQAVTSVSVAGDLTTAALPETIFTGAARLFSLDVNVGAGEVSYFLTLTARFYSDGTEKLLAVLKLPATAGLVHYSFGTEGLLPFEQVEPTTAYAYCYATLFATYPVEGVYTDPTTSTTTFIQAVYIAN